MLPRLTRFRGLLQDFRLGTGSGRRMKVMALVLAANAVFSSGAPISSALAEDAAPKRQYDSLPFVHVDDDRIVIKASLNDARPVNLLIATGTLNSLIDEDLVACLGGKRSNPGFPENNAPGWKHPHFGVARFASLKAGAVSLSDAGFLAVRKVDLRRLCGGGVDGVLGASSLRTMALGVDYQTRTVGLWYPGGLSELELVAARFPARTAISTRPLGRGGLIEVPIRLRENVQGWMKIDTGSGHTVFSHEAAGFLGLAPQGKPLEWENPVGSAKVYRAVLEEFEFAGARIEKPDIRYFAPGQEDLQATMHFPVGRDVLKQRPFLLDGVSRKFYWRR